MRFKVAAATVVAALVFAAPAAADKADCSKPLESHYSAEWHATKKAHGKRAPGRNIRRQGVRYRTADGYRVRDARCHELRRSLGQLRRLRSPAPAYLVRVARAPGQRPAGTLTASVSAGPALRAIAQCESGGNYGTNTGNGFYGAYQFDLQTWQSVGGTGLPSNASPAEQDKRAAILRSQRGSSPWPVCGR
jgi:hypothetical protein